MLGHTRTVGSPTRTRQVNEFTERRAIAKTEWRRCEDAADRANALNRIGLELPVLLVGIPGLKRVGLDAFGGECFLHARLVAIDGPIFPGKNLALLAQLLLLQPGEVGDRGRG